jgi:hypothetical protein
MTGSQRLIADRHTARFLAVAASQNIQWEATGERVQDLIHIGQHEMILLHVGLAHVFRQTGTGGLLAGEIVGRLFSITHMESSVQIQVGRLFHHVDQLGNRNGRKDFPGSMREPHVTAEQASVGLAHFGKRLASDEMRDGVLFEARIWLAPTQYRKIQHAQ